MNSIIRLFLCHASLLTPVSPAVDLEAFLHSAKLGFDSKLHPASAEKLLLSWMIEHRLQLGVLYKQDKVEVSDRLCSEFSAADPRKALFLTLASSNVFPLQRVNLPQNANAEIRIQFLLPLEPLRKAQCEWFCKNEEFRRRFVRLNLWSGRFLGHSSPEVFYQKPLVVSRAVLLKKTIETIKIEFDRKTPEVSSIVPAAYKLRSLMLMTITSREDLVARIAGGESEKQVFLEWHSWFLKHRNRLVQRSDLHGWSAIRNAQDNTTGVLFYYPDYVSIPTPVKGLEVTTPVLRQYMFE